MTDDTPDWVRVDHLDMDTFILDQRRKNEARCAAMAREFIQHAVAEGLKPAPGTEEAVTGRLLKIANALLERDAAAIAQRLAAEAAPAPAPLH